MLPVFDAARAMLLGLNGVTESVVWHGVPWRWTLVYKHKQSDGAVCTRAFAYLIPDPARLQCCVPLSREQITALPIRRFKKHVREPIVHARTVAGLSWPSWDIPTRSVIEDLGDLILRKHRIVDVSDESVAMSA